MAGLAASDSSMPVPAITSTVANSTRSTLNHHSARRLLSARDKLIVDPNARLPRRLGWSAPSSPPRWRARQARDQGTEGIPAQLEVAKLVIGGAGRGEQHDRLRATEALGVAGGRQHRRLQRAAALERHLVAERCGKGLRRLPDQE